MTRDTVKEEDVRRFKGGREGSGDVELEVSIWCYLEAVSALANGLRLGVCGAKSWQIALIGRR